MFIQKNQEVKAFVKNVLFTNDIMRNIYNEIFIFICV